MMMLEVVCGVVEDGKESEVSMKGSAVKPAMLRDGLTRGRKG